MRYFLRPALCLSLLTLAACDEIAVAGDPVALADLRGQKTCVAAVAKESQESGVAIDTTIPVVELNRYIVNAPKTGLWTCITDANGNAIEIVNQQTG